MLGCRARKARRPIGARRNLRAAFDGDRVATPLDYVETRCRLMKTMETTGGVRRPSRCVVVGVTLRCLAVAATAKGRR